MDKKEMVAREPLTPMEMIAGAVSSGASLEMIEKLMGLQERWEANLARKAFEKAMAGASAEMPTLVKNKVVGYDARGGSGRTSYKHEDLAEIVSTVAPILGKHGLSHRFETATEPNRITVTCVISHELGHSIRNSLSAGADTSGSKNAIQAIGSTITYLARYSLKASLGLAASVDDDGVAHKEPVAGPDVMTRSVQESPPEPYSERRSAPPPSALGKLTIKQVQTLENSARAAASAGKAAFTTFWRNHNTEQERAIIKGLGGELASLRDAAEARLMAEAAADAAAETGGLFDPETGEVVPNGHTD